MSSILNRVFARLTAAESNVRMPKKRRASRFVSWFLWSKRNAFLTVMGVAGVVSLLAASFFAFTTYRMQVAAYEAKQAIKTEQAQAAAAPTTSSVLDGAQMPGGIEPLDPTATTAAPTSSTPTTAPTATATATVTTAAATPPAGSLEDAPQAAARRFITAWTFASQADTQEQWLQQLAPLTSPQLLELFKSTDRTKVPSAPIVSMKSLTVEETHTSHVSVQMDGLGWVGVVLQQDQLDGAWKVVDVAPEADE